MMKSEETDGSPLFNVGIVGCKGAGKSVYLTAMQQFLSTQRETIGFSLQVPIGQARWLSHMLKTLDGYHEWLPPTDSHEFSEWNFTLNVLGADKRVWEACRFRYYDYAGGLLTNIDQSEYQDLLQEKIANCQALIGVIDGRKVFNAITHANERETIDFEQTDLPMIIHAMKEAWRGNKLGSIQFIVTKWDFLTRNNIKLNQVVAYLDGIKEFKEFISTVKPINGVYQETMIDTVVRVIPVSAVGQRFVTDYDPNPAIGMVINKAAKIEPWNVETPLACIFIDVLKSRLKEVKDAYEKEKGKQYISKQGWFEWLKGVAVNAALNIVPRKYLGQKLLSLIYDLLEEQQYRAHENDAERERTFLAKQKKNLLEMRSSEDAFAHAAEACNKILIKLDTEFGANKL